MVFSHEGADEQEADVREFITTYRTRFTPTKDSSLARDLLCHFITALRILRHVNRGTGRMALPAGTRVATDGEATHRLNVYPLQCWS